MNEEIRKGNVVAWKRVQRDLICVVEEMKGDQVAIRYIDTPRGYPPITVDRSEVVKLAEEQESYFQPTPQRQ